MTQERENKIACVHSSEFLVPHCQVFKPKLREMILCVTAEDACVAVQSK